MSRDGCPNCGSYNMAYHRLEGDEWEEECHDCEYSDVIHE